MDVELTPQAGLRAVGIMRGTRRRDMGATTHFHMGSTTYFCATKRHKKHKTDQQFLILIHADLCYLWLRLRL